MPLSFSTLSEEFPASQVVAWTMMGGLAVLDQGLFAGANFAANILLARWLSPPQYGAFALAFSVFLFAGLLHTALLTEPMMVFGPAKYSARFERYLGVLFRTHFAITLALSLLLLGAGLVVGELYGTLVAYALGGAALATPCILLLWLARRAFYVGLRPGWAAAGGACYCVISLSLLALLRATHLLGPATALAAMGAAALAVAGLLAFRLHPRWHLVAEGPRVGDVVADHWRYGRWSLASAPIAWFPTNIYFLVLPLWFGLREAGALKALMNLSMPALQSGTALGVVLQPVLVRHRAQGGRREIARTMRGLLALLLFGAALYALLLWSFRFQVLQLLYGGMYAQYALWPLFLAALLPFAACFYVPFEIGLRALERPDLIFKSWLATSLATVVCGVPLSVVFGVNGALTGMILSLWITSLLNFLLYRRETVGEANRAWGSAPEPARATPGGD